MFLVTFFHYVLILLLSNGLHSTKETQEHFSAEVVCKMSTKGANLVLAIGNIRDMDCGKVETDLALTIIAQNHAEISRVFSSYEYTIYANDTFTKLWAAGKNYYAQCPVKQTVKSFDDKDLTELTEITYFTENNITIKSIFVDQCSFNTFFISDQHQLYACGKNADDELGIGGNFYGDIYSPVLIPELRDCHVIQAANPGDYCFALIGPDNATVAMILSYYSRRYSISADVIDLMILFIEPTKLVSTNSNHWEDGVRQDDSNEMQLWNEVSIFKNRSITKIACGLELTLFLEENGSVWSCGDTTNGRLGLSDTKDRDYVHRPEEIEYFKKNEIRIIDIKCGGLRSLALDDRGNVYSWGNNRNGECGHTQPEYFGFDICQPKKIEFFDEFMVDNIKCGWDHSYVHTKDGGHYLFGGNAFKQCVHRGFGCGAKPFRINETIHEAYKITEIVDVSVGYFNTKIICKS